MVLSLVTHASLKQCGCTHVAGDAPGTHHLMTGPVVLFSELFCIRALLML